MLAREGGAKKGRKRAREEGWWSWGGRGMGCGWCKRMRKRLEGEGRWIVSGEETGVKGRREGGRCRSGGCGDLIHLPNHSTPPEICGNQRYYTWFADCVGAIDGTHIHASVPLEIQGRFRGLKGFSTQNVLAAISFNLKFTYVLAVWEGFAHDSCVLHDAFSRPHGLRVLQDFYILVFVHTSELYTFPLDVFMLGRKNPTHDKYINKKIDMYNEMALVVDKDLATEIFAKGFIDVRLEAPITLDDTMDNTEEVPVEKDIPSLAASTFGTKQHCKRSRSNNEIEKISEKLGEVAAALTKLTNNRLIVSYLYAELMKIKDYDDKFLATVFDHLVQNEMLAMAFMAKVKSFVEFLLIISRKKRI
ncbi:hypothetical protein ACH5RR_040919 [Cinchona calisaya]|uniref:DDE Tnp4 domain-containing protein n=1 Tax=Cinchona calisaya TaxID=153742 RepID=A0ABD2XV40_9GENT